MARRTPAPVRPTPGQTTAQTLKKIPRLILWVAGSFTIIGLILAVLSGLIGNLFAKTTDGVVSSSSAISFGMWFGLILGLLGIVVLLFRFMAFEDVQLGGRTAIAGLFTLIVVGFVIRFANPLFEGHPMLRAFFWLGIVVTAGMMLVNMFLDHKYKNMVTWGVLLILLSGLGVVASNYDIRNLKSWFKNPPPPTNETRDVEVKAGKPYLWQPLEWVGGRRCTAQFELVKGDITITLPNEFTPRQGCRLKQTFYDKQGKYISCKPGPCGPAGFLVRAGPGGGTIRLTAIRR